MMKDKIIEILRNNEHQEIAAVDDSMYESVAQEIVDEISFPVWQDIHCCRCGELNKVKYYSEAQIAKRLIEEYYYKSKSCDPYIMVKDIFDWLDRRDK